MPQDQKEKNPAQPQIQVQLASDHADVLYSDIVFLTATAFGLNFDFGQQGPGQIRIVGRIGMSPQHAKAFAQVLQQKIIEYERKFGAVALTPAALAEINSQKEKVGIGFK